MVLPEPFTTAAQSIASYDSTELASGLGFSKFWLLGQKDNAAEQTSLVDSNATRGFPGETRAASGANVFNFDSSPFNIPRTIKGVAYLNIGYHAVGGVSGSITAKLQKWNGTSGTDITAEKVITVAVGVELLLAFNMPCTQTLIPAGEQLRLVVTVVASGNFIYIGSDPANDDATFITPSTSRTMTASNINIPFKIDL